MSTVDLVGRRVRRHDAEAVRPGLAEIWTELTGVRPAEDDRLFRDHGADMLLALRLTVEVFLRLDVELPPRVLAADPTFAGLVEVIAGARPSSPPPRPRSAGH